MLMLLAGLVLFFAAHGFIMARSQRAAIMARLGDAGYRIAFSVVSLVALVLIVKGYADYRAAGYIQVWDPPVWTRHLALLVNLPVFILLISAYAPGEIKRRAKHPMLAAVKLWATAHLLANGDLGSILLFGSFLVWAVIARIAAKRRGDAGAALVPGWTKGDMIAVVGGLAVYLAIVLYLHRVVIGVPVLSN